MVSSVNKVNISLLVNGAQTTIFFRNLAYMRDHVNNSDEEHVRAWTNYYLLLEAPYR